MAKQLWFSNLAAAIHRGVNDAKLNGAASWWAPYTLSETRGGASTGALTTPTVAGPTNGIEWVVPSDAVPTEWISNPLSADFTISGTITLNLWAKETANAANAAINAIVEKIDGATGALTQIVKTARVTELTTTSVAVNFTAAPTSTACKKGDRLRVRVFADDAGTMGVSSYSFDYNGATAAASGDSYIQFTENLTFSATVAPTGSTYYLTDAASTINPGSATEKQAATTRGSGTLTAVTNTANGPTAGIQITDTAGGTTIEWYTPPLEAVTLGGQARYSIFAKESNAAANASLMGEIAVTNGDGSGAAVWAKASGYNSGTVGGELGTTDGNRTIFLAGADLNVTAGQRLRFRVYVEDMSTGPLVTGHTVTVTYNNPSTGIGDSLVILPVVVTEQAAGTAHTVTPTDSVALTDSLTSAKGKTVSIPDTLALADLFARATTAARSVTDPVALTDARTAARGKALIDAVTLADLLTPIKTGGVDHTRPITDTVVLADTLARAMTKTRTLADTLALTDARSLGRGRTLADTLALVDSLSRVMAYGRTYADGLVLVDSTRDAQGIRLGDILLLTDQLTRVAVAVRSVADTVALSDATTRTAGKTRALADAVALTDQLARAVAKARALADTIALTDQLARATTKARTVADTLALTDARAFAQGQALTDTVALADQLARVAPRLRTFADAVLLSDAVLTSKTGAGQLNPADLVLVADSFTRLATYTRSLADTLTLTDARALARGKRVADQVFLADLLARATGKGRTITDLVLLTDHVLTQKIIAGAPVLNYATDIRWGLIQADDVYVGEELVWTP